MSNSAIQVDYSDGSESKIVDAFGAYSIDGWKAKNPGEEPSRHIVVPRSTRPAMTPQVAMMANLKHDPAMDRIPSEVMQAEQTIIDYMKEDRWELGRLCSRNHAEDLRKITDIILKPTP